MGAESLLAWTIRSTIDTSSLVAKDKVLGLRVHKPYRLDRELGPQCIPRCRRKFFEAATVGRCHGRTVPRGCISVRIHQRCQAQAGRGSADLPIIPESAFGTSTDLARPSCEYCSCMLSTLTL